jgi:hypothetical protein
MPIDRSSQGRPKRNGPNPGSTSTARSPRFSNRSSLQRQADFVRQTLGDRPGGAVLVVRDRGEATSDQGHSRSDHLQDELQSSPEPTLHSPRPKSLLGTDEFGIYGCEASVAYAFGVAHAEYGWDGASGTMYQNTPGTREDRLQQGIRRSPYRYLAREWDLHIRRVQRLSPGYVDGSDIQILPSPSVGDVHYTYRG